MTDIIDTRFNKVLIIDDTKTDLYITNRIIVKSNFAAEVLQFSMAEDALKYLQENNENIAALPQVMFVDIHMPTMNGFQFMEEYNKLSATLKNNCRVFVISSSIDNRDIAQAKSNINILGFQEKPITKQFLADIEVN